MAKKNGSKTQSKVNLVCNECEKKFSRVLKSSTVEIQCPKCNGYDVEIGTCQEYIPTVYFNETFQVYMI